MLDPQLLLRTLRENPVLLAFLILGLGLLLGRIRVFGVELGSVAGVLLVGLVAGHLQLATPRATSSFGFILFIYAVGVQSGPRFLGAFRSDGPRYIALTFVTAATAAALAGTIAHTLDLDLGFGAGMLAGALTSTPTLVAAQDAVAQGLQVPPGMTEEVILRNISSAYAITYVFGMAGLILLVGLLPRLLRVDLAEEARRYGESGDQEEGERAAQELPSIRAYRSDRDDAVRVDEARRLLADRPGEIQKIKRGQEVFEPTSDMVIERGDIISFIGTAPMHEQLRSALGPEVLDDEILDRSVESRSIVVTRREIEGRTLQELDFPREHQCWLTRVTRLDMDLPRRPDLELQRGDALLLTGARGNLDALADRLGFSEARTQETDLVTFAFGIALGLLLGLPELSLGQTRIGLGAAGGVLVAGLLMGLVQERNPMVGRLPYAASHIIMELGLLMFMMNIAVKAGTNLVAIFLEVGPTLALCGAAVTVVPVLVTILVGRYLLKMNAAILLGAVTGAMTSTGALKQITGQARSSVPLLGYVGTYAFANVLLTTAGALLMRI